MRTAVARTQEAGKRDQNREQVTSVERALSILELLASRNQGLSTSEISREELDELPLANAGRARIRASGP